MAAGIIEPEATVAAVAPGEERTHRRDGRRVHERRRYPRDRCRPTGRRLGAALPNGRRLSADRAAKAAGRGRTRRGDGGDGGGGGVRCALERHRRRLGAIDVVAHAELTAAVRAPRVQPAVGGERESVCTAASELDENNGRRQAGRHRRRRAREARPRQAIGVTGPQPAVGGADENAGATARIDLAVGHGDGVSTQCLAGRAVDDRRELRRMAVPEEDGHWLGLTGGLVVSGSVGPPHCDDRSVRAIATAREVHWGGRQLDRRVRTDDTDLRHLDFPAIIDGLLPHRQLFLKPLLGVFREQNRNMTLLVQ